MHPQDYNDKIIELVRQSWEQAGKPLLLSQLGNEADGTIARYARDTAGGLERYLYTQLATEINVIYHSDNPKVKFALPINADISEYDSNDELIEKNTGKTTTSKPRIITALWAAFRKSLESTKKRYLHMDEPIWFKDLPPDISESNLVELDRRYIASDDLTDEEVYDSIRRWANDNHYSMDNFIISHQSKSNRRDMTNLFDQILMTLKDDELKRVSMPLDIVKRLKNISV